MTPRELEQLTQLARAKRHSDEAALARIRVRQEQQKTRAAALEQRKRDECPVAPSLSDHNAYFRWLTIVERRKGEIAAAARDLAQEAQKAKQKLATSFGRDQAVGDLVRAERAEHRLETARKRQREGLPEE